MKLLDLILLVPMIIEIWDDRKGEQHPSPDWAYRIVVTLFVSLIIVIVDPVLGVFYDLLRCILMSIGIYIFLFPYIINIVLYRNGVIKGKWWDHLSKTAWPDRLDWWRGTPWYGRMFFTAVVFIVAAIIYFDPYSTSFFYK